MHTYENITNSHFFHCRLEKHVEGYIGMFVA